MDLPLNIFELFALVLFHPEVRVSRSNKTYHCARAIGLDVLTYSHKQA